MRKQIELQLQIHYITIEITTHTNSNYITYKFKIQHILI
jgi:hypothetical protein